MALNNMGLGFLFTAKDMASKVMKKLQGNLKELDDVSAANQRNAVQHGKSIAAGAVMIGVGAKALRGSLNLASSFGDFEQGLARVGAVARSTPAELKLLEAAATKAGLATQFSPTEAVLGLQQLASVGFDANQSIALLDPSLGLAAAGMITVEQATGTLSAATKIFNLDLKDSALSVDKLNKISNLTSLQQGDLQLALGNVARGASVTGQNMDEMLIAMGLVKNTGVEVSSAATGVSTALIKMAQNSKAFKKIGVDVTDASGKFRPMIDVMLDVTKHTDTMGNEAKKASLLTKLFGIRGLGAAQAIGGQLANGVKDAAGNMVFGAEAAKAMRDQMSGAAGTTKDFVGKQQAGFKGQVTLLKGSIQTLGVTLGKPIAAALLPVIKKMIAGINWLITAFQTLPGPVQKVIGALMILAPILLIVVGTIKVVMGVLALYKLAMVSAAALSTTAGATIGASFMVAFWWLAIIGLIIGAAYLIWDNWEAISGFMVDAFEWVTDKIADGFLWLVGMFKTIGKILFKIFIQPYITAFNIVVAILGKIRDGFVAVGGFIVTVWEGIVSALTPVFDFVMGIMSSIGDFIDWLIGKIEWVISKAEAVGGVFSDIGGGFMDGIGAVGDFAGDIVGGSNSSVIENAISAQRQQEGISAQVAPSQNNVFNAMAGGSKATPINLTLNTNVDGEIVASATKKFMADEKNRSFGNAKGEDT